MINSPSRNPASPIRLTTKAFLPASDADCFWYQKPMSKYEQRPTPSQLLVLRGDAPPDTTGNLLLDHLLGAQVIWAGQRSREEVMEEVAAEERAAGRHPYPVPLEIGRAH